MTTAANIYDALGQHDIAAALRWSEDFREGKLPTRDELDAIIAAGEEIGDNFDKLEAMLCNKCAAKWDARE